jgi:hypothetical protein
LESHDWTVINISWLRDVIEYTQDVAIYVWQPHLVPPEAVGVSICISPSVLGDQQAVVVLKPSKSSGQALSDLLDDLMDGIPNQVKNLSGIEVEIVSTILSMYALFIADTALLVTKLFKLIEHLVSQKFAIFCVWSGKLPALTRLQDKEGRANPSVSKIHYTLYLGDCQRVSNLGILNARSMLSTLSNPGGPREFLAAPITDWITSISNDLSHLQSQLKEVSDKLDNLRHDVTDSPPKFVLHYADFQKIKDQLDLRQVRLSRLLTILAAIYLPFSFVSVRLKIIILYSIIIS